MVLRFSLCAYSWKCKSIQVIAENQVLNILNFYISIGIYIPQNILNFYISISIYIPQNISNFNFSIDIYIPQNILNFYISIGIYIPQNPFYIWSYLIFAI
jgi:hypothetical protein